MAEHTCCACFTHNNLSCCNAGHSADWTGAKTVQRAWDRSPLLASLKALIGGKNSEPPARPDAAVVAGGES